MSTEEKRPDPPLPPAGGDVFDDDEATGPLRRAINELIKSNLKDERLRKKQNHPE